MATKYCPACGEEVSNPNAVACTHCGEAIRTPYRGYKSSGLAAILSFFIPGLGQIYNGQIGKGIMYMIFAFIFLALSALLIGIPFVLILWILGIYDAYSSAEKINRGEL